MISSSGNSYILWGTGGFPDIPGDFPSLEPAKAKEFYAFFVSNIPRRMKILAESVRSTKGFSDWAPDYSDQSVLRLGDWVKGVLTLVPEDEEGLARMYEKALGPGRFERGNSLKFEKGTQKWRDHEYKNWEFADLPLGLSICTDIGTYIAECLRARVPEVAWWMTKRGKSYHRYNKPTLQWIDHELDPIFSARGCVSRIILGTHGAEVLLEWLKEDTAQARRSFERQRRAATATK